MHIDMCMPHDYLYHGRHSLSGRDGPGPGDYDPFSGVPNVCSLLSLADTSNNITPYLYIGF